MLNDKLYKHYYPLKTEEEKNDFLNSQYAEIYKEVENLCRYTKNELSAIKNDYISKMKPTVSYLGTPKNRNIAHNKYIAYMMYKDISCIEKKIPDYESLMCNLRNNQYENITIHELNYILELMNINRRRTLVRSLLFVALIIACVCICLFYMK